MIRAPVAGPAMLPMRVVMPRTAIRRPRFSNDVISAITTDELVDHIATPVAPMNSRAKNCQ